MNPKAMQSDPALYRNHLLIPSALGVCKYGEILAPFQRNDFAKLDPALIALSNGKPATPHNRFWIERTKGGSKDTDLAVSLLWLLAFSRRALRIQVGAFDAQQADEVRLIVKGILRLESPLNRLLNDLVDVQANRIVNKRTESVCEILTTDSRGSHGSRPDMLLCNELSHISDQEFAETLLDNSDKVPGGIVVIATNAGFVPSWQFDWRATAMASARWHFSALTKPSPWLSETDLAESRKRNSATRYARLWHGKWVREAGDAIDADDIARAVTLVGPIRQYEPGYVYLGALDVGVAKDRSAFIVLRKSVGWTQRETIERPKRRLPSAIEAAIDMGFMERGDDASEVKHVHHEGSGVVQVCDVQTWTPTKGRRVDLDAVERAIIRADEVYGGLSCIGVDPWQAEQICQHLTKRGLQVEQVNFTAGNLQSMALSTTECFQSGTLELYPHDELLTDIGNLSIVDKGRFVRLDATRNKSGHADAAIALAIGLHLASRYSGPIGPPVISRPLVYS